MKPFLTNNLTFARIWAQAHFWADYLQHLAPVGTRDINYTSYATTTEVNEDLRVFYSSLISTSIGLSDRLWF